MRALLGVFLVSCMANAQEPTDQVATADIVTDDESDISTVLYIEQARFKQVQSRLNDTDSMSQTPLWQLPDEQVTLRQQKKREDGTGWVICTKKTIPNVEAALKTNSRNYYTSESIPHSGEVTLQISLVDIDYSCSYLRVGDFTHALSATTNPAELAKKEGLQADSVQMVTKDAEFMLDGNGQFSIKGICSAAWGCLGSCFRCFRRGGGDSNDETMALGGMQEEGGRQVGDKADDKGRKTPEGEADSEMQTSLQAIITMLKQLLELQRMVQLAVALGNAVSMNTNQDEPIGLPISQSFVGWSISHSLTLQGEPQSQWLTILNGLNSNPGDIVSFATAAQGDQVFLSHLSAAITDSDAGEKGEEQQHDTDNL